MDWKKRGGKGQSGSDEYTQHTKDELVWRWISKRCESFSNIYLRSQSIDFGVDFWLWQLANYFDSKYWSYSNSTNNNQMQVYILLYTHAYIHDDDRMEERWRCLRKREIHANTLNFDFNVCPLINLFPYLNESWQSVFCCPSSPNHFSLFLLLNSRCVCVCVHVCKSVMISIVGSAHT